MTPGLGSGAQFGRFWPSVASTAAYKGKKIRQVTCKSAARTHLSWSAARQHREGLSEGRISGRRDLVVAATGRRSGRLPASEGDERQARREGSLGEAHHPIAGT